MIAYILRRLLLLLPMAAGMIVVTFGLLLLIPGDPASVLLGPEATPDQIARLRDRLGLNDPWYVQLGLYFGNVAQGDLGMSIFQSQPVLTVIFDRLGATIELAVAALLIATVIGVTLGILAATRQGSWIDTACMLFAQLGVSMPVYWLGILLMLLFAVTLGWLPSIGRGEPIVDALGAALTGRPGVLLDSLAHLLMPAIALGANSAAIISRLVRTAMLEVLREDFVRTAYSKGLRRRRVMLGHVFRNALMPVISIIGLRFGILLGGAVLTEQIFGWPGLGQLTITAISQRDLQLIQGVLLSFGLIFALVNLVVDLAYAAIDPRVRLG
ncbi:MAG: ABC transporter permease [Azospirillaceae bacterium]